MNNLEKELIIDFIKSYKNRTIELDTLESIMSGNITLGGFAEIIIGLEKQGVLIRIGKKTNNRKVPLALKYRINKSPLSSSYHEGLQKKQFQLHKDIKLDNYFKLNPKIYEEDLIYIDKINGYLKLHGIPEKMYVPELSLELVDNEKWIDEEKGEALLKRVKLWDKLLFHERIDPVAFSINLLRMNDKVKKHLIMENKTAYFHAKKVLRQSDYATVIYGQGWKITSGIQLFEEQLGCFEGNEYYYFGDIDSEGLSIFNILCSRVEVKPAIPFYLALLEKRKVKGHDKQRYNQEALDNFALLFEKDVENKGIFSDSVAKHIENMLKSNYYQPQELLKKEGFEDILLRRQ